MRFHLAVLLSLVLGATLGAQDRHNWDSLANLKPGDRVVLSLTNHSPINGAFQSWTPEKVTVADVSANKQEVLKLERYREGGSRGKRIAIGALIGFGAGFAIGAAADGSCSGRGFAPCIRISRGEFGAITGAGGAAVGAVIGAVLPHHSKQVIYTVK